jgi:hypothetical protein
MIPHLPLASGDGALFGLLAGLLLLVGASLGLMTAGAFLALGKSEDRKKLGRRLLLFGLIPIIIGAIWWVAFVGLD